MNLAITLTQAATLISTVGHSATVLLRGQPGIGKSSLLTTLAASHPDYHIAYVDVANLDLGDLGMPVIDRDRMVTNYAPAARFGIAPNQAKPVLLMLDELGKAPRPVLNMLLPVILEHRLGDVSLPEGSIVFGTTNLDTDGVGDNIPAHAYNRMTVVNVANPTPDEWIAWAMDNGVTPEVLTFVKQYPHCLECYADLEKDAKNPYIFNPRQGQVKTFVSPRSLAKASELIKARHILGEALLPALAGTVGEAAARDIEALTHLADSVPTWDAVTSNPTTAKLPANAGGYFLMAFMLAGRINDGDTLAKVMPYVLRWENFEASTLFASALASNSNKVRFAVANKDCVKLMASLGKYF